MCSQPHHEIDINSSQPARMMDFIGGGASHFSVDRDSVTDFAQALPGGLDAICAMEDAVEFFRERAVRYLAGEAGIRQFLVLDVRLPGPKSVHHIAQRVAPGSRTVYLVSDPVVLAHAHELRSATPEGASAYVTGSVEDPEKLLREAARMLDLSQPVAVMLLGALTMLRDEAAKQLVSPLVDGVASGSYIVVTAMASDLQPERIAEADKRYTRLVKEGKLPALVLRDHAGMSQFFDGLELIEPGVVPLSAWSRAPAQDGSSEEPTYVPAYAAVARKRSVI